MSKKSKDKGKSWERDIATDLSLKYGESFIRVPHSGAYIGGKNQARKEFLHEGQIRSMKGDIIPPLDWKYFNCEAKNYADFPFHNLYNSDVKQLESWLEQLLDVADTNDLNILIFKITRKGKYIAVQLDKDWDTSIPHTQYHSTKTGIWLIFDYDLFWQYNLTQVEKLSKGI